MQIPLETQIHRGAWGPHRCVGASDIWGYPNKQGTSECMGCTDAPYVKQQPLMPASKVGSRNIPFKVKFLHQKNWKIIREPPDHTGNEPTLDIPMRPWAGHKKQKGKYMPFVRNMLIMKHVHYLNTEKKDKNLKCA